MIISKKKLDEKIREALEQAERERYIHEKIDRVDKDCQERIDHLHRSYFELLKQIESLQEELQRRTII